MHPRNIYKDSPPDFKELAVKYPYFRACSRENKNGDVTIDFKEPRCLRALTCALLQNDFDLRMDIPLDRLIPTLPLRLNYILWVEDLIGCLSTMQDTHCILGIDIGTGASCIYPLLGAKMNGWRFIATEIDQSSATYAENNVRQNGFADKIRVKLTKPGCYLKSTLDDEELDMTTSFCMCNPPFFSNEDEATLGDARTGKRPLPISVNTGSAMETITSGGEVEFVKGIIEDSLTLRDQISMYTTMLGKKSSVKCVLAYLKEKKITTVATTRFCQGKTMRWGVAWTFLSDTTIHTISTPSAKRIKKQSKCLSFGIPLDSPLLTQHERKFTQVIKLVQAHLDDLKINVKELCQMDQWLCSFQCFASEITWCQPRKKRRELQRAERLNSVTSIALETSVYNEESYRLKGKTQTRVNVDDTDSEHKRLVDRSSDGQISRVDVVNKQNENQSETDKCSDQLAVECAEIHGSTTQIHGSTTQSTGRVTMATNIPLCTFWVHIKEKEECKATDSIFVEVECIHAENNNHVYQLYQYLKNTLQKQAHPPHT